MNDGAASNVILPSPEDEQLDVFNTEDLKSALLTKPKSAKVPGEDDMAPEFFKYSFDYFV